MNSDVRAQLLAERDQAIELLLDAQTKLGAIHPESVREPILWGLRATVELCRRNQSLLGLRVDQQLALAHAIIAAWGERGLIDEPDQLG